MPSLTFASRATRCSLIAAATVLFAGASALAQGALPQLLPYTVTAIAGNAPTTPATVLPTYAVGTACLSGGGKTATDTVGDGCLATEVTLNNPRYVTEDAQGNVYFSDSVNARIRRIEMNNPATLGVITTYVGGAATQPASVATCNPLGTTVTDTIGDGNLATTIKLTTPSGLVFDASGNLYFADSGTDTVRKVDATTKIVTLVAGNCANTYGYATNSTTPAVTIPAATKSYLNFPYGLALNGSGALFIADEGNQAVEAVNLNTVGSITVNGITIPAGTIAKVAGYGSLNTKSATNPASTTDCPNFTAAATGSRGGCYFAASNALISGYSGPASSVNLDNPYDVAVDAAGNLYLDNTYPYQAVIVNSAGTASQYAGTSNVKLSATTPKRGPAQTVSMGSDYGMSLDKGLYPTAPNLYISDGSNGMVWRVDGTSKTAYQVAGASTACASASDTVGDGCPANSATFSHYSSTSIYGIAGLFADNNSNLMVADAGNNLIREISSGTQFGQINGSVFNTLQVHFDAGDTFSSAVSAASITSGSTNFTVSSFTASKCTTNSDTTVDCFLTLTATPTTAGAFTGTLQITSSLGKVNSFPLSGYYITSNALTSTAVTLSAGGCTVSATTGSASATTLTARIASQVRGPQKPSGSVDFYVDGTKVGTATLGSNGLATFDYTFPASVTPHTYYAKYLGDTSFGGSQSPTGSVTASAPTFTLATVTAQHPTVHAGASALYSFTVTPVAYNGTITFSCSGLPAGAACVFYPSDNAATPNTLTVTPCGGPYVEALTITTQSNLPVIYGIGAFGKGKWAVLGTLPALLLAMMVMLRRRKSPLHYTAIVLAFTALLVMAGTVGCGKDFGPTAPGTPSGTSTITITGVTGSGLTQTQTVTLTVN